MINPSFNAFSLRRLNPFSGTLQIFSTRTARALSSNGFNWEIQILSDSPQGLWANTPFAGQKYYTFGIWSATEGLRQVPLHPLFNINMMIDSARELTEGLAGVQDRLPFPREDHYELWLLDEETGQPIALLASAQLEADMAHKEAERWVAAARGDFDFVSQHLSRKHLPVNDGHNPRVHASVLEALVSGRGGQKHRRAWYWRDKDGSGKTIQSMEQNLPAKSFPQLPLTLDWEDADDQALIMDYIGWKDRFAETRNSSRQRAYRDSGRVRSIYTPGWVVNGREWKGFFRGKSPDLSPGPKVGVLRLELLDTEMTKISFEPATADLPKRFRVQLAVLGSGLRTPVGRGENSGKTLDEEFVVLGWRGKEVETAKGQWTLPLPMPMQAEPKRRAVVAWLSSVDGPAPLQAVGGWLP